MIMRKFDKYHLSKKQSLISISIIHLIGLLCIATFPSVVYSYLPSYTCNNNNFSTEADVDTFSRNLKSVWEDLAVKTSYRIGFSGFSTCSYGESPNRIYGLLQCTDNISQNDCSVCSKEAVTILQVCGNAIGGRVWLDNCFLRYDNSTFFSKLDTNTNVKSTQHNISTNDIPNFTAAIFNLLSNLSGKAGDDDEKTGFAEGSAAYSSNGTVYGLVQCWKDISVNDCRTCLQIAMNSLFKCCSVKQGAEALLGSCRIRYEAYPFFHPSGRGNPPASSGFYVENPAQSPRPNGSSVSSKSIPRILGIVGGVGLALAIYLFSMWRKLKSAISLRAVIREQNEEIHDYSEFTLLKHKKILFSLEALIESTDNFHESNKLGGGGFGSVYEGKTKKGKQIAVKKLCVRSTQGNEEFMNEVKVLANVRDRNLVKLLGCCAEGRERLIVYEYLPNKSLNTHLFDPDQKRELPLDWPTRYKIILGIASGLRYLHEESEPRIIHRDIKANNILLDKTLNPKISDFGLAKLFPEDESHIQTRVAGTYGYMAPEYAMLGQLSTKADVYSFGVLVLEIVSGRKISDIDLPQQMQSLLEWGWRLYNEGRVFNMIDFTVRETCRREEAERCIHVALLCTQADAGNRPTISDVILMISSPPGTSLPKPKKPAFVKTSESNFQESRVCRIDAPTSLVSPAPTLNPLDPSVNNVTITEVEGR